MSQLPTRLCGESNETPNCIISEAIAPLLNTTQWGTPPLKIDPPIVYILAKVWSKSIHFFSYFCWLMTESICEHLECFVMLGTQSQVHKGQMSQICIGYNPVWRQLWAYNTREIIG